MNFVGVLIVLFGFFLFVGKSMLSSLFQLAFYGGDLCRLGFFVSAVQSALHRVINWRPAYLEPNSQSMQKPIGGRSVLALFTTNSMLKVEPINKGAIVSESTTVIQHHKNYEQFSNRFI